MTREEMKAIIEEFKAGIINSDFSYNNLQLKDIFERFDKAITDISNQLADASEMCKRQQQLDWSYYLEVWQDVEDGRVRNFDDSPLATEGE